MHQQGIPVLDLAFTATRGQGQPQTFAQAKRRCRTKQWRSRTKTLSQRKDTPEMGIMYANNKHAQSQDTGNKNLQQGHVSGTGDGRETLD